MKALQRLVVLTLLGVWFFPAVSQATPLATPSTEVAPRPASSETAKPTPADTETGALAAREQQSQDLQNFKGGEAVVYIGGGGLLILILVLIILL